MRIKRFLLHTAVVLAVLIVAMLAGASLFIYWDVYNVSALHQHTRPVFWLLDIAMGQSIHQRAEEIRVPPLSESCPAWGSRSGCACRPTAQRNRYSQVYRRRAAQYSREHDLLAPRSTRGRSTDGDARSGY